MTSWQELRDEAARCTRCDLYQRATQTVFGEGRTRASIALVGEQPGDQEDKQGHPFVGPAGRVLDRAMGEAGLDRDGVYLTNAVKHFKWIERGKRRIHQRPNGGGRRSAAGDCAVAVLRIFAITGIDQVIPNFARQDEALAQVPAA